LSEWEENPVNWKRKAEFDDKGDVIIPERWFKACVVTACKKTGIVPHFATSKKQTYTNYAQSLMVLNNGKPLCKKNDLESYGAFVGAQGFNSKTKVWRVRPMKKDWSVSFEIVDAMGRMKIEELKTIIEYGGMMIGLGDNRINNFGRFEIKSLKEIK